MKPVLLLVHRIPYPPNKGDKIRSFHILKYLANRRDVILGAFVDDPSDWQYVSFLRRYTKKQFILPRNSHFRASIRYGFALLKHQPLSNAIYKNEKMQNWVSDVIQTDKIKDVLVFSSQMAQYIEKEKNLNKIIDFVDVDSLKWEQYSQQMTGLKRWIYKREANTLSSFEKNTAQRSRVSIFVTENEVNYFKNRSKLTENIISLGNGVDTDYFSPQHVYASPFTKEKICRFVFTGMMDYWPNVDAVIWFTENVLPKLREAGMSFKFYIVGGNPDDKVKKLSQLPDVVVTGRVPDMRPYLFYADFSVAPLRIARGIQNKVLEALSLNCPIIVSPFALEGINLPKHNNIRVAKSESQWIDSIKTLSQSAKPHGENTHQMIQKQYSWDSALAGLDRYLV